MMVVEQRVERGLRRVLRQAFINSSARDVFLADQAANSLGRRRDSNIQISKPVTRSDSD